MKRPAFMFYPADWRKDPELRVCSIAARGLWIDMIALMHEGDPYGHLVVSGRPVSAEELARLVGEPAKLVTKLLAELETHNVFSRNADGVAFSRRMVADEHIRNVRAAAGKLGGNPNLLHKAGDNGVVGRKVKQTAKQNPTPSVAVAGSVAEGQEIPASWPADGAKLWTELVGATSAGRVGKALTAIVAIHGWPAVRPDLAKWVGERKRAGRPCRVEWYAAEASARITAPPPPAIVDKDGCLTEYGERITRPDKVSA